MKTKIFIVTGILVFVTLTCPITASESHLTKEFRKRVTPENIDSIDGCRQGRLEGFEHVRKSFFEAAIDADDLGAIRVLLERRANIECRGSTGEPPLHYAIRRQKIGIMRELLAAGANCNAGGINNERPIHIALKEPVEQILLALLRHRDLRTEEEDLKVEAEDFHHNIALHWAASCIGIDSAIVKEIIQRAHKINAQNKIGYTPLSIAIRARNEQFALALFARAQELLPREEIDLSICNAEGNSPLHVAVAIVDSPHLSKELMDVLVARADAKAINKQQGRKPLDTPISIAIRLRNEAFARALLVHTGIDLSLCNTKGNSPLHVAAAIDDPFLPQDIIDALVARANAKAINKQQGREPCATALIIAIRCNNIAFVEQLLARRDIINPNVADASGQTPLIIAIERGRDDCVRALLAHPSINPNLRDAEGKTPLIIAIEMGRDDCVRALLTHPSIDPNFPDAEGKTPLIVAIEMGRSQCILDLLKHKTIGHNIQDRQGNTPAHHALVTIGFPLALRNFLLTRARVKYSIEDETFTDNPRGPFLPVHIRKEIVSRANLRLQNNSGNTPIHIVAQIKSDQSAFVQFLLETASGGLRAMHTFNVNGQLPCDVRVCDDKVKELVTPYLPIRWYFWSVDHFSKHDDAQDPVAVDFVPVTTAQQPAQAHMPAAAAPQLAAAGAPQQAEQLMQVVVQGDRQADAQGFIRFAKILVSEGAAFLAEKGATALVKKQQKPKK